MESERVGDTGIVDESVWIAPYDTHFENYVFNSSYAPFVNSALWKWVIDGDVGWPQIIILSSVRNKVKQKIWGILFLTFFLTLFPLRALDPEKKVIWGL